MKLSRVPEHLSGEIAWPGWGALFRNLHLGPAKGIGAVLD